MPLLRRRKHERRSWTAEPVIPPYPGADMYGNTRSDSIESAMQVPAVWACVRLLADAVSSMDLKRYRNDASGIPQRLPDGLLLESPGDGKSLPEWVYDVMVSANLRGNTYGRITDWDDHGKPQQIAVQNPDMVRVGIDDNGLPEYRFNGQPVPMSEVWHLRGRSFPGSVVGLSPISFAAQTIGLGAMAERFGSDFFANGAHPSTILTSDQTIDQEAAAIIKERFRNAARNREPVAMGLGVSAQMIQVKPEESQFLATQKFTVSQIARIFGVPAEMIGGEAGGSMTYANVEQRSLDFLVYSVQPWLRRIEASLSMLLPSGEFVRFDTASLLRTDAETRAKVHAIQVATKTRTPDEARREDQLPPLTPEQLKFLDLVPLEVTPLGGVKALPTAAADQQPDSKPAAPPQLNSAPQIVLHPGAVQIVTPEQRHELNITTPEQRHEHYVTVEAAPAPDITIQPAEVRVTVEAAKSPDVRVYAPTTLPSGAVTRRVERDADGNISRIIEE